MKKAEKKEFSYLVIIFPLAKTTVQHKRHGMSKLYQWLVLIATKFKKKIDQTGF
jgi:hypothetical protein